MAPVGSSAQGFVRGIGYYQHRACRLAHDPVGGRTQYQTVKSASPVCSHDDHFYVLFLSKRENAVGSISLMNDEFRLNVRRLNTPSRTAATAPRRLRSALCENFA